MLQKFKIAHLYPKHMSLYGDRGNIIALAYRSRERAFEVEIQNCAPGEKIAADCNLIMLGGGQDQDQDRIVKDLLGRRNELIDLISAGALFLGICGGYQLLGEYYETAEGNCLEGLKILNLFTKRGEKRIIGNAIAFSQELGNLVGFENHGGRTYLNDGLRPLAQIRQGGGNNGEDKTEGVLANYGQGLILGTYFHGCLPRNPNLTDYIIGKALNLESQLSPLNDSLEKVNQQNSLKLAY